MEKKWSTQVFIAFDQFINAFLGGWADESLSSRSYRTSTTMTKIIDVIFFWEKNHCLNSYLSEKERLHLPPILRDS